MGLCRSTMLVTIQGHSQCLSDMVVLGYTNGHKVDHQCKHMSFALSPSQVISLSCISNVKPSSQLLQCATQIVILYEIFQSRKQLIDNEGHFSHGPRPLTMKTQAHMKITQRLHHGKCTLNSTIDGSSSLVYNES